MTKKIILIIKKAKVVHAWTVGKVFGSAVAASQKKNALTPDVVELIGLGGNLGFQTVNCLGEACEQLRLTLDCRGELVDCILILGLHVVDSFQVTVAFGVCGRDDLMAQQEVTLVLLHEVVVVRGRHDGLPFVRSARTGEGGGLGGTTDGRHVGRCRMEKQMRLGSENKK